jgi:hypothetical protein
MLFDVSLDEMIMDSIVDGPKCACFVLVLLHYGTSSNPLAFFRDLLDGASRQSRGMSAILFNVKIIYHLFT